MDVKGKREGEGKKERSRGCSEKGKVRQSGGEEGEGRTKGRKNKGELEGMVGGKGGEK